MSVNLWYVNIFTESTKHESLIDSVLFGTVIPDFEEYSNAPNCLKIRPNIKL